MYWKNYVKAHTIFSTILELLFSALLHICTSIRIYIYTLFIYIYTCIYIVVYGSHISVYLPQPLILLLHSSHIYHTYLNICFQFYIYNNLRNANGLEISSAPKI